MVLNLAISEIPSLPNDLKIIVLNMKMVLNLVISGIPSILKKLLSNFSKKVKF